MQILRDFARVHIVLRIAKNSGVSNIYSTIFFYHTMLVCGMGNTPQV